MGINYAGVMATRKNSYAKHFIPSTATVDPYEEKVQEYLSAKYAGDNVLIKVEKEGKRPHTRLWEWNMADMLHGVSAKSWLQDKLKRDFDYTTKQVKAYFDDLVIITVKWDDVKAELGVVDVD
jgi:hypothetical protein